MRGSEAAPDLSCQRIPCVLGLWFSRLSQGKTGSPKLSTVTPSGPNHLSFCSKISHHVPCSFHLKNYTKISHKTLKSAIFHFRIVDFNFPFHICGENGLTFTGVLNIICHPRFSDFYTGNYAKRLRIRHHHPALPETELASKTSQPRADRVHGFFVSRTVSSDMAINTRYETTQRQKRQTPEPLLCEEHCVGSSISRGAPGVKQERSVCWVQSGVNCKASPAGRTFAIFGSYKALEGQEAPGWG